jgi:hypothetical protein
MQGESLMAKHRRLATLLIISLLGLMLLLFASHTAHHGHHPHHDCAVCRVMDGWFSLLKRAAISYLSVGLILSALLLSLSLGAPSAAPRQGITPVTLKVKITS